MNVGSPALRSLPAAIDKWLAVLHLDFSIEGMLGEGEQGGEKAAPCADFLFSVKERKSDDTHYALALDVIFRKDGKRERLPISKALKQKESLGLDYDPVALLRAPTALSNYLPEIRGLMSRKEISLDEKRLAEFLDKAAPLLTRLGVAVELPKALSRELRPRLVMSVKEKPKKGAGSLISYLDLDTLLDWKWQVAVGNEVMDVAEFKKLLTEKREIVRFRDGFVKLDADELARLLERAQHTPDRMDFIKARFTGETLFPTEHTRTITDLLFEEKKFPVPASLHAELRPYQMRGYNWVCSLLMAGFGCILADDMGLGKTIQSISALLRLREEKLLPGGTLVIAPAALLENWERELGRFAPDLRVAKYHGPGRKLLPARESADRKNRGPDVYLTTYQTAVRDVEKLQKREFSLLVVDEAHLLKNADTRASQTVKMLGAGANSSLRQPFRLALSGTPVENRLEDLRSIFDFVMPGYLGGQEEFRKAYRVPIEIHRDKETAERLNKITSPFLLRRLKTDKSIIADLPDKIVINEYAGLEKEQAALYESLVAEMLKKSEDIDKQHRGDAEGGASGEPGGAGRARSALILTLLTGLKQICDHPRVYDTESAPDAKLSGKALMLLTLLNEMLTGSTNEKTLIFSQYVETLELLQTIIKNETGMDALLYHGGLPAKRRQQVIDTFQNDSTARILLVSLRAGGLGLNLTAASQVFHYDLWYNPSVENQATDRAFRIGQKRNVFVHRFITRGTFEEKIEAMLKSKSELAGMTVSSGESWLAKMTHAELAELFGR
jgi:SNF2 family DNA or RNA helicase